MTRGGKLAFVLISLAACFILIAPIAPVSAQDNPQFLLLNKPDPKIIIPGLSLTNSKDIVAQGQSPYNYYAIPWIAEYIKGVYQFGIGAAVVLAIAMIVFGGFIWMTAGGNAQQVTTAKGYIIGAITGIVLALGSYSILYLINPNLTQLTPLRVPIIGRIGIGNYCSPIIQTGEVLYELTDDLSAESQPLNPGDKTDCGAKYVRSLDPETTDSCIGSSCSSGQFCVPMPELSTDSGLPNYTCDSDLAKSCKVLKKDLSFVATSHPPEAACDELNSAPGVLEQGRCVWWEHSEGCVWCSNDGYERFLTHDVEEVGKKNPNFIDSNGAFNKSKFCSGYSPTDGDDTTISCLARYCE